MAISYKVWDFPTLGVKEQLFYAPGQAYEGGFTSGGVRITSPEPGGRAYLEVQLAPNKYEWDYPFVSWLMSKCSNGDIFRVKLTATPQLLPASVINLPWDNDEPWDNNQDWDAMSVGPQVTVAALEGEQIIVVDMTPFGNVLRHGHVIGYQYNSYMIDDITYDGALATITVSPPFRRDINVNDYIRLRPVFTGSVVDGVNFRKSYDAADRGLIMPGKLTFSEVILP